MNKLYPHQEEALKNLSSGKVLVGGVGSGKSLTSIAWFFTKVCDGQIEPFIFPKSIPSLYIITTAKKRDDKEWDKELLPFLLNEYTTIDSWNNIQKYTNVKDSVFIFDEQRLVGKGAWVKAFLKIAKSNKWILLTATPGDKWEDYFPIFKANGFFRTRTEFNEDHVIFDMYSPFPKVKSYKNTGILLKYKREVLVFMNFDKGTEQKHIFVKCEHDETKCKEVIKNRWDIYKEEPIQQASGLCYVLRRIVNSDVSRIYKTLELIKRHPRTIIFYNFNYELDALRQMCTENNIIFAEWNGQKHEQVPTTNKWVYLVQYTAGNEGWNCITCSSMIFFSMNYSYKIMVQAAGRIDRMNTPYKTLYYYHLESNSLIDKSIKASLSKKKKFNEKIFDKYLQ